jgi:hypothetical protein
MNILKPNTITDAMVVSSDIAEPAAGETAWVSAGSYTVGDVRIRTTTHRQYTCILTHTGRTALPESDPLYWVDTAPTQKWAPFDSYTSTAASRASSLTYVLSPGFVNVLGLYGVTGSGVAVTVKDGPGGAVLFADTYDLTESAGGLYEYLFSEHRYLDRLIITGLPLHPTAEITLAVTGGGTVTVGMITLGKYVDLVSSWGGTQYGASAEPMTYSRIKTDEFGNTTIKRGHAATSMRAEVILAREDANYALKTIQSVLDVPVGWVATGYAGYEGLNVFGLGSAVLSYESHVHCKLSITVKGLI